MWAFQVGSIRILFLSVIILFKDNHIEESHYSYHYIIHRPSDLNKDIKFLIRLDVLSIIKRNNNDDNYSKLNCYINTSIPMYNYMTF